MTPEAIVAAAYIMDDWLNEYDPAWQAEQEVWYMNEDWMAWFDLSQELWCYCYDILKDEAEAQKSPHWEHLLLIDSKYMVG